LNEIISNNSMKGANFYKFYQRGDLKHLLTLLNISNQISFHFDKNQSNSQIKLKYIYIDNFK
jgi:hypothetical protein